MEPDPDLVKQADADDMRWAKALSHPIRVRALRILTERVASPSDIARELDLPIANVSYHIQSLLRLGCIEEVEHRHVRGAIEHMYRAVRRPLAWADEWQRLPDQARDALAGNWLRAVLEDLRDAVEGDMLSGDDRHHLSRTPLRLDEQAAAELSARLDELLDWAMGLQADAVARLADGERGGREVDGRLILAAFERRPR
jgi:DNA-binding transcriptional ArsR family regulator